MMAGATFTKHADGGADLPAEAAALAWLGEARAQGGMPVAEVMGVDAHTLVERRVQTAQPTADAAERIGRALAHTHAAGAAWFGAPPSGMAGDAYVISYSRTPVVHEAQAKAEPDTVATWGAFFWHHRILGYVRTLVDEGTIGTSERLLFERLGARLLAGDFDAAQPALVGEKGHAVARIHGDLWAGNVLFDADPANEVGGTLIDPMAHGGHAETDLAMLALFGLPYLPRTLAAYNEVSPLADGWTERVALHQLAPLLHHCVLFGGGYVAQTLEAAHRYV